jgi:hypothetical protein
LALASPHFSAHRSNYVARAPRLDTQQFADELTQSAPTGDILDMLEPPDNGVELGEASGASRANTKYLWLVGETYVVLGLENGATGRTLSRGRLAHTNLSGGRPAHTGGELWFRDERSAWINGGSGRYPPRNVAELESVADAARAAGYVVCCAGWDSEQNRPQRMFRGDEPWL